MWVFLLASECDTRSYNQRYSWMILVKLAKGSKALVTTTFAIIMQCRDFQVDRSCCFCLFALLQQYCVGCKCNPLFEATYGYYNAIRACFSHEQWTWLWNLYTATSFPYLGAIVAKSKTTIAWCGFMWFWTSHAFTALQGQWTMHGFPSSTVKWPLSQGGLCSEVRIAKEL